MKKFATYIAIGMKTRVKPVTKAEPRNVSGPRLPPSSIFTNSCGLLEPAKYGDDSLSRYLTLERHINYFAMNDAFR